MKMRIYWICYAIAMIGNTLSLLLFRDRISITLYSALPISTILCGLLSPLDRRLDMRLNTLKYDGRKGAFTTAPIPNLTLLDFIPGLTSIPLLMPFVFFFPNLIKGLVTLGLIVVTSTTVLIVMLVLGSRQRKEEAKRLALEREEQEEKESMGEY